MKNELKKKRVFVAVPFDEEAKRGIKKVLKQLERKHWPVRWERVEKLHVTLAFLGWIDMGKVQNVQEVQKVQKEKRGTLTKLEMATREAVKGMRQFAVGFKGLGGFPDLELPRVVWVGLKGDLKSLAKIYKVVRLQLEQSGFILEGRPFVPHVTLGRIRKETRMKQRQEIGKQLAKLRQLNIPQHLKVDRVVVYESVLRRSGSEYRELTEVRLG